MQHKMHDLQKLYHNPFQFDFLVALIIKTQRDKYKIRKEWEKISVFLEAFPQFNNSLEDFSLKQELVIDSFQKIYSQMCRVPEYELELTQMFELYYYDYDPSLLERWEKEQIELGDKDSIGLINTGCCVILKMVQVNIGIFSSQYHGLLN